MTAFTAVATGNPTNATDINQLINALNGTTAVAQMNPTATSNTSNCWDVTLPSAPGTDNIINTVSLTGDSGYRAGFYVLGASGHMGGVIVGDGTNVKGHLYGVASGFRITESLTIDTGLTVSGTATLSGSATFGGSATFNSTSAFVGAATFDSNILLSTAFIQNAATANSYMGFGLNGSSDTGIYEGSGQQLSLMSSNAINLRLNTYNDGSNDRFITSGSAMKITTNIAPAGPNIAMGYQVAFSGTPGAICAWGQNYNLALMLGGLRIFVGSGDPTSAAGEGDLWFAG